MITLDDASLEGLCAGSLGYSLSMSESEDELKECKNINLLVSCILFVQAFRSLQRQFKPSGGFK